MSSGGVFKSESVELRCGRCGQPLNRSQWRGAALKSCPNCSTLNGAEHVFHIFPEAFGLSDARPMEGAQSYCAACRSGNPPSSGLACDGVVP